MMKIISWNVNGLRAVHRKDNLKDVFKEKPDILCLQEIKAEADQLPDEVREPKGYHAYFNSSNKRKGYSGVAVYTKVKPEKVSCGMMDKTPSNGVKKTTSAKGSQPSQDASAGQASVSKADKLDQEGRLLTLYFKDFVLLNVYFPNGGGGSERLAFKLEFYDEFLAHVEKLKKKYKKVIFCGDVNTAHEEIDLARPKENETHTGFLPEERAWLDEVVTHGYVDVFRHLNPNKKDVYTYWDMKTRARDRNVGWRIDYFFVTSNLLPQISSFETLASIYGSDHCPIVLKLKA